MCREDARAIHANIALVTLVWLKLGHPIDRSQQATFTAAGRPKHRQNSITRHRQRDIVQHSVAAVGQRVVVEFDFCVHSAHSIQESGVRSQEPEWQYSGFWLLTSAAPAAEPGALSSCWRSH